MGMASDREERNGSGSVLIIGGGLAGLKAAIDLAQIGWRSIVIERKSDTGGAILGLERQYPTDSCGFCHILPDRSEGLEFCLRMGLTHPSIEIIKNASLLDIRGKAGSFKATILKEASYVDEERCIGCGLCIDACPQEFPDPFEESLFLRKAIDRSSPYSSTFQIDLSACTRCANCAKVCPVSAIDLDANQKEEVIEAGAIIVATGFETLKPKEIEEYGYGKYPDVITSMEFERLMGRCLFQGGDSWKGRIRRPSDGKEPKRIAFIQCVGSRTKERPYCSSICCMIAIKEARMAIHHIPGVHCEIFFMDIRACGKGYEAYYKETRDLGVRMTRCIPGEVIHRKEDSALILRYEKEDGILEEKPFDLVVLSVGLWPSRGTFDICRILGLDLDTGGFMKVDPASLAITGIEGVYVCGAISGPKDIGDTVVQAGEATFHASNLPVPPIESRTGKMERPVTNLQDEGLRAGVFICSCSRTMKGLIDLDRLLSFSISFPNVLHAELVDLLCTKEGIGSILKATGEKGLNSIVIAGCSPRVFEERLSRELPEGFPIDPCLFDIVNIREQVAWVHGGEKERAFRKASALISASLSKASSYIPLDKNPSPSPERSALVIGGGIAGLVASLSIASRGYRVDLVEKDEELGGNLRHIFYTLHEGFSPQGFLREIIDDVKRHPLISIYTHSTLLEIEGIPGSFLSTIVDLHSHIRASIKHGSIVIATGADPYVPDQYLYGKDGRVITQRELEGMIFRSSMGLKELEDIVMIQCVGSRNEKRPYCSRICCTSAIKNAIKIKDLYPETRIFILYRDMMTLGQMENHYRKAREKGVLFIRYDPASPPDVLMVDGALEVRTREPIIDAILRIKADLIVLSTGIEANKGNLKLAEIVRSDLDRYGFFAEVDPKFRPLDLKEGIFMCGLARSPQFVHETVSQARACAMRVIEFLSRRKETRPIHASVNRRRCSGCGLCVEVCPAGARFIEEDKRYAKIIEDLCRGCGTCTSLCPNDASQLNGFMDRQILSMVDAIMDVG